MSEWSTDNGKSCGNREEMHGKEEARDCMQTWFHGRWRYMHCWGRGRHNTTSLMAGTRQGGRAQTEERHREEIWKGLWWKKHALQTASKNAAFQRAPSLFVHGAAKTLCLGTKKIYCFRWCQLCERKPSQKETQVLSPPLTLTTAAFHLYQTRTGELVVALRNCHHVEGL